MSEKRMLVIEWKHLDVEGETCERCAGTIQEIHRAVEGLQKEGKLEGVTVRIRDTPLGADRIEESNAILINGVPIEAIVAAEVAPTPCPSCSTLTGQESCCRALDVGGTPYEQVPADIIRSAVLRMLAYLQGFQGSENDHLW